MQDNITREITVKAPKEKVYNAITDPKQITNWFPDVIEGNLEVGKQTIFVFTNENHRAAVFIEAARPFSYFAYRWVPGGSNSYTGDVLATANTLVEFNIEETTEGIKVTVKESGFSKLPAEVAEKAFKDNSGGWGYMMGRLEKLFNQD